MKSIKKLIVILVILYIALISNLVLTTYLIVKGYKDIKDDEIEFIDIEKPSWLIDEFYIDADGYNTLAYHMSNYDYISPYDYDEGDIILDEIPKWYELDKIIEINNEYHISSALYLYDTYRSDEYFDNVSKYTSMDEYEKDSATPCQVIFNNYEDDLMLDGVNWIQDSIIVANNILVRGELESNSFTIDNSILFLKSDDYIKSEELEIDRINVNNSLIVFYKNNSKSIDFSKWNFSNSILTGYLNIEGYSFDDESHIVSSELPNVNNLYFDDSIEHYWYFMDDV